MLSSSYENYRKELIRYHDRMTVYAVVKKNFPSEEDLPYYSLDVEIEIAPKSDEDIEKKVISQLYKSYDLDSIIQCYNGINNFV